MTHYKSGIDLPSSFVTKQKQRLKQHNSSVYLNDGDAFEIELFNPQTTDILARIEMNGKSISSSGIVIRPGERIFLQRFFDTNNKFIFNTYEVSKSIQSTNAIRNNGKITIRFYNETVANFFEPTWNNYPFYGYHTTGTSINWPATYITRTTTSPYICDGTITTGTSTYCNTSNLQETGKIEKGNATDQTFMTSNSQFDSFEFHKIEWQILPISKKPITSSDIKLYCTGCGGRIKKNNYKFCPTCGTKVH